MFLVLVTSKPSSREGAPCPAPADSSEQHGGAGDLDAAQHSRERQGLGPQVQAGPAETGARGPSGSPSEGDGVAAGAAPPSSTSALPPVGQPAGFDPLRGHAQGGESVRACTGRQMGARRMCGDERIGGGSSSPTGPTGSTGGAAYVPGASTSPGSTPGPATNPLEWLEPDSWPAHLACAGARYRERMRREGRR